jgi:hypothetical protein
MAASITLLKCDGFTVALNLQKCWMKEFQDWEVCNAANKKMYRTKFEYNIGIVHDLHQKLYLGGGSQLQTFKDQRLVDYW